MASNELKLNLKFKVDTVEAKAKMHDLEKSLNNLFHVTGAEALGNSVNSPLLEANETVLKLHNSLKKAFNTDTGKLNLVKFNQEAKTAGLTVNKIADTFTSLGYEGKQAFEQLTWAIAEAETPIKRVNKTLDNFKKDLIKTARWQLSSNIIHGLQSGLEGAYRYAQDLNKSLNDIRIVTGHNVEYMSKFAVEANKAAKALSTSTNEYAKASLIYFQQGLEDQEVRKRADTTVKLANVTGQTAEEVSSYMTAVWNNFADGSKELEYYADVITKLGAATASSSEEIATGLQKFSAVAETVGLSYEYATAALATVTSQTRESAETVGTAFKTIFARLESLSLGETLDDDTSMTKYSQALASVGVNIKNSAGELKNMDSILDELGDKWNSISKDQQLALAQTVAGMRQYNNFMALMNNYDTFTANVELGSQATGSLKEQHEIYAESWEAASARVQAAAEDVYDSILNDEFFIKLTNGVEKLITGFGKLVDSVGGMEGVFGTLGLLLTKFAGKQIASGIEDAAINIKGLFGTLKDEGNQVKLEFLDKLKELYKLEDFEEDSALSVEKTKANFLYKEAELQELLLQNDKHITDEAKEQIAQELEHLRVLEKIHEEQVATAADMQENAGKKGTEFKANFNNLRSVTEEKDSLQAEKDKVTAQKEAKREEIKAITDQLNQSGPVDNDETKQKRQKVNEIQEQLAVVEKELERAKDNEKKAEEEYYASVNVLDEAYDDAKNDSTKIVEWAEQATQEAERTWGDFVEITEEVAQEVAKLKEQLSQSELELEDAQKRLEDSNNNNKAELQGKLEKAKREDVELEVQEASLEGEIEDRNDWANQAKNIALSINSDNQAEIDAWDLEQRALEEKFNAEQAQKEAQFNTDQAIKQEFNTAIDQFGNKELSHDDFNKKVQEIIDKATEVGAKELEEALKEIQADQSFGAQTVGKNKDKEDRSKRYERIKGKKFADADATYEKATYEKDESKRPELRKKTFEEVQGDLEAFAKEKGLSAKDTEELIASGLELAKTYRQNEEAAKAAAAGQEVMNNEQKKAEDLIKESVDGGRKWTELLVDTGGAVAGLTAGFSALKNAADIWTDDSDLSFWDRLKSSVGSLAAAIPTLVIAYKTLNKVITDQTTKKWLLNAADAVNNKLTKENTQLQKENTEARDENNEEVTEDIEEKGKEKVKEVIKNPSKLKEFSSKLSTGGKDFVSGAKKTIELKKAAKAAKLAGTAGKAAGVAGKVATVAPGAAGAAASASGAAAGTAGAAGAAAGASGAAALGSIAVAAAPYVLAAAAIAAVAIIAYKHYNKAEDLAKEAEARAEALQGLANSAKESYQELSQAVTGFEDANNALKDLTKGTKEWNEALEASNEQARSLIDQFGTSLKAGDYFFNSDGQIQFKEGVLEELQAKQADAVAKTQATADFAKIEANEKRAEANLIKFSRKKVNSTKFGFDNNAQEQAGLNKLMDVYKQDSAILDKLWAAIDSGNEASFAEQYDVSVDLIKALTENREATEQLFKETAAAANQSALLRQSIIENANKGNAEYANSEYKEIINAMAANDLENVEQSEDYQQALKDFDDLSFKNEDDQKKILQALYGENASKYRFTQTGGGDVTLETQDEDGNWVLVEGTEKNNYKKSTIKQQYAKAIAAGITTEEMTSLKDRTNKLVSDLTGMGFDSSQINAIGASLEKGAAVDLTKASRGALSNITDDSINNLDEKYQELMRKAKESTEQMWAEASTIYRTYAGENAEFSENHTLESLRTVTSAASKIAIRGGTEAATAFTNYADSIIDSYPSKADEINSILQNIDWDQSGPEAMADLRMQLEDIGISVNTTSDEWKGMLDEINKIKSSVDSFSLDKLRQEIAQTKKILDGLKNGNDIISDEDYKKLSEYSADVADMFTLTAEGYKFIGGATEAENRSKIKELEKITIGAAFDKSEDQLNKIDLAEKAKATMELDKNKADDPFEDMKRVAKERGGKYKYFLEATDLDADELNRLGQQGQDATAEIKRLEEEQKQYATDSTEYEDLQKDIELQEGLLAEAKSAAAEMYEKGEWVDNLDPDQARKDITDLTLSEIDSLDELMTLEKKYANDPNYAKAFKARKTQLENEFALRRESIDTTQDEQAALKALNKEQEELAKKKKLSSGQDYLNNLTEEVKLINKEVDLYNKLAKNKEGDRNEAQSNISSLLGPNVAIKKDADGNITNWEALDNAAMAMSREDVKLYQRYKKEYNQAAEDAEEYRDKIKEAKEDQKALWLEGATYTREYNDSIRELQYDWLEEQLNNLEDAEYSAAERMALLGQKAQLVKEESGDLTKELDKIAAAVHIDRREGETTADFMARIVREAPEAKEKIDDLAASYLANANSMKEIDKELANTLVQHFDQVAAQYDKVGDRIQRLSETTDHYKNIINLVGKKNIAGSEETLKALGEMQQRTANATLENSRAKYDKLKADQQAAQISLQAALDSGDEAAVARWTKTLEEIDNKVYDAQTEMNNDWAAALQTAADVFAEETATILENFESSLAGTFSSFDRMQEVFSQQSELNSQYVADYKRVYELSKLTRDIQNQIDNTDSITAKSELKDLQAEINELQESGAEMSQYDLDYLQKRYDLRLAELALEEARNAKSQVRLQKTENGGWGYVYTQNEDAVSNAQQNYEDKLYALQELSDNYLNETSEKIISTQANFEAAIQQIMSSGLSDEEKKEQVQETVEFYREKLDFLTSEFDDVIANNQGMANMVQSFSESLLGAMYPEGEFDSADNIFSNFNDQVGDWESGTGLLGELKTAMETFKEGTVAIFTAAGQEGMEGFMAGANAHANTDMDSGEYEVDEDTVPDVEPVLNSITETREALAAEYERMMSDYMNWLQGMANTKLVDGQVTTSSTTTSSTTGSGSTSSSNYTYSGVGNTTDRKALLESWGVLTEADSKYLEDNWADRESSAFQTKMRELWQRAIDRGFAASFDTGGYTGSWGSSGRMAMLHEKELVLNKEDTANLLKMVQLVDNIIKSIDASSFAALSRSAMNLPSISSTGDTLQQEVTIHAEFPNATNHSEIEQAFNDLVNRAAQYTGRRK